jgi:hypothetical protein
MLSRQGSRSQRETLRQHQIIPCNVSRSFDARETVRSHIDDIVCGGIPSKLRHGPQDFGRKRVRRTQDPTVDSAGTVLDLHSLFESQRYLPQVVRTYGWFASKP